MNWTKSLYGSLYWVLYWVLYCVLIWVFDLFVTRHDALELERLEQVLVGKAKGEPLAGDFFVVELVVDRERLGALAVIVVVVCKKTVQVLLMARVSLFLVIGKSAILEDKGFELVKVDVPCGNALSIALLRIG